MCCCNTCKQKEKNDFVSKKILEKTHHKDDGDFMVNKISLDIKEHYQELTRCVAAVNKMVDTLNSQTSWPPVRCERERQEVECCYETEERSGNCSNVVRNYVDCEHYQELTCCVAAVNKMADTLNSQTSWPPVRCEREQQEVETEERSGNCSNVVRNYVDCVRNLLFL